VDATGDWHQYKTFDLGTVEISKAGEYAVIVRPAAGSDHDLMYF
jgi:hypothetical protein